MRSYERASDDTLVYLEIKKKYKSTVYKRRLALSKKSADDSIHSNDYLDVNAGTYTLDSGDDAMHADTDATIDSATITINNSYEGIEALDLVINSGDDGLNAACGTDASGMGNRDNFMTQTNGSIVINGGNINITVPADGIDSNGSLEILGGTLIIQTPTMGDTSVLDYESSATIENATLIKTGANMFTYTISSDSQGVIESNVNGSAGSNLTVSDDSGELLSTSPSLDYNYIIISSPDIISGSSYNISIDDEVYTIEAN